VIYAASYIKTNEKYALKCGTKENSEYFLGFIINALLATGLPAKVLLLLYNKDRLRNRIIQVLQASS
jgi:hypothetical protein